MEKNLKYAIRFPGTRYDNGGPLGNLLGGLEDAKLHDSLEEATERLKYLISYEILYRRAVITPVEVYTDPASVVIADLLEANGFAISLEGTRSFYVGTHGRDIPYKGPIDKAVVYGTLTEAQERTKELRERGYSYALIHPVKTTADRTSRLDLEAV